MGTNGLPEMQGFETRRHRGHGEGRKEAEGGDREGGKDTEGGPPSRIGFSGFGERNL